jgi:hypothetical protein
MYDTRDACKEDVDGEDRSGLRRPSPWYGRPQQLQIGRQNDTYRRTNPETVKPGKLRSQYQAARGTTSAMRSCGGALSGHGLERQIDEDRIKTSDRGVG